MSKPNRRRTAALSAALAGGAAIGAFLAVPAISSAQTTTTSPDASAPSTQQSPPQHSFDKTKGGHQANGKTEELLTGETADKVRGAALAANPGATVDRVETDAEGDAYEAHMTKADGTEITVKFDESFNITKTETGGPGSPGGAGGPHGPGRGPR